MCTKEHKETYFEIIMSISFASLKHLKLPISISEYLSVYGKLFIFT